MSQDSGRAGFTIEKATSWGRIGELRIRRTDDQWLEVATPTLFPVACLVTGTTARGGGLWKYVLHANKQHGLMRRNMPLMAQVFHFLDFGVSPQAVTKWRQTPLRDFYNETHPNLNYEAPLFLDSGGFKLLFNTELDLSAYDIPSDDGTGRQAHEILRLQQDFGGDIIATLDYPLPPGLVRKEAKERMQMSQANAILAALQLQNMRPYTPFLYVAAHGQDGQDIEAYVSKVFKDMKHNGLADIPFGIAIGSLVPLRGAKKYSMIVELVQGAIRGIPKQHLDTTPIHVFGVTGNLIPLLVYLGVDTFDSSTYAQQARSLRYFAPKTHKAQAVLEMQQFQCNCRVCSELDFDELHESLTSDISYKRLPSGHYKSKYYADIALHNLEMDFRIVQRVRDAVQIGKMTECLLEQAAPSPGLSNALELLAKRDEKLRLRLGQATLAASPNPSKQKSSDPPAAHTVSLRYTPDSFHVNSNYHPPEEKRILLVLPCSGGKPYSTSRSHQLIAKRLTKHLETQAQAVHKVTLSGLYGPVPEEFEEEEAVLHYDFRLDPANKRQIDLCVERMIEYLARHEKHYVAAFGYATSLAYRTVLEKTQESCESFRLYPTKPRTRRLTEFFRQSNVKELLEAIRSTKD